MKKQLPDELLIELARKAKPVPVSVETKKSVGKPKTDDSSVLKFIQETQLKAGRNPVEIVSLYEAYTQWGDFPVPQYVFTRTLSKLFKRTNNSFKVNMKIITLLEIVKEINNEKNKTQQNEVSGT